MWPDPKHKHDLVVFLQAAEDFGFGAVGDAGGDGSLAAALFGFGIVDIHGSFLVFVVNDGRFRHRQHVFVLLQQDFGVSGHHRFQLATGIINGDAHLEGGDVIFLRAHGSDLGDMAVEALVFE